MKLHVAVECNGCKKRVTSDLDLTGKSLAWAYGKAKEKARLLKWLFKNEGSKGIKHYCPDCYGSIPEIAVWHMKRILNK